MCGRITQKSSPDQLRLTIRMGTPDDPRVTKSKARYNGAPTQDLLVIRKHPKTGECGLDLLRWDLSRIGPRKSRPSSNPSMQQPNALQPRRCSGTLMPGGAVSCRSTTSLSGKRSKVSRPSNPMPLPCAQANHSELAAIWDGWKHPETEEVVRTFCIITTDRE